MVSQKQLIELVAATIGAPVETVTVIDRYLAEAGFRTRALRGRGSTPMTYQDAANMIIATAWDANPKDAVRIVKAYCGLPPVRVAETAHIAKDALGSTFGEALANMLESVPKERAAFSSHEDAPGHMSLRVKMFGPEPRATITLVKEGRSNTFEFGPAASGSTDLRRTVEFSQITVGFVGEAVAEDL
ncbi:hypothetical protein ACUTJJ_11715 [Agrobacterium sp. DKPNP3]|uniref:hypothetical protein n=1 Tax=Agrobacterium TaxID=357 RepID=UPI0028A6FEA2|nr:hypothetical protein [Agrobacterium pusense]